MASIVGVLASKQNKPLSQWGFGQRYLSPNVVVSLLGTLGKSACLVAVAEILSQLKWIHYQKKPQKLSDLQLFDDASRGPWGALQLASRKNMKALLATCASIITITCLLIDPFIQSVFSFPRILTPVQGQLPTILSSHSYSIPWNESASCYEGKLRTALQGAIIRPVYNATREPYLPCSFERCEWPTVTTLGVCSNCVDLKDTIASTCEFIEHVERPQGSFRYLPCNYSFPGMTGTTGDTIMLQASFTKVINGSHGFHRMAPVTSSTIWNSTAETVSQSALKSKNFPALVSRFTFVQFDTVVDFGKYGPDDLGIWHDLTGVTGPPVKQAGQCTMQLCAKTFETPHYENFTATYLTGSQVGLIVTAGDGSDVQTLTLNLENANETSISKNKTFWVNGCDYQQLSDNLYSLFDVSLDNIGISYSRQDPFGGLPNSAGVFGKLDDIPALVSQIADSLTEEIRTSVDSFSTNGVGMNSEVFIVIDWVWLALPISVTVLTFVLLLVVIITNHARGMPAWRSSNLALLFHEVDGWDSSQMVIGGPEDMKARAKEMEAQVTYEEDLLLFSKAK